MMVRVYCSKCSQIGYVEETKDSCICLDCGNETAKKDYNKVRYRHLTKEQRETICNGCGGKGGYVVPPYGTLFLEECNQHDFNYFRGHKCYHRWKADFQLFIALLKKVWHKDTLFYTSWKLFRKVYLSGWALLYYVAVTCVGWKFFYYGSEEQEI